MCLPSDRSFYSPPFMESFLIQGELQSNPRLPSLNMYALCLTAGHFITKTNCSLFTETGITVWLSYRVSLLRTASHSAPHAGYKSYLL